MDARPLRVVIADDHPLFRDGMRALIATEPVLELVGEAATGQEVMDLVGRSHPDLVLLDIQMPELDGIAVSRALATTSPATRVLVMSMFEDEHLVFAAIRAGARGYVLKGAAHDEVLRAIRAVGDGEAIFSRGIASRVLESFNSMQPAAAPRSVFPELSEREREVLQLLARGEKNAAIAQRLVLSPKTVRNHVSAILRKLQVLDRTQAAVRAREAGL
jgi:DNA-binding NarL/FixJ family response regulator